MPVEYGVTVEGLDELRKALRKADKETAKAVAQAGKKAADIVAQAAKSRVPLGATGRARASVRAVVVNGGGGVKGGGPKAPYFGYLDYGNIVNHRHGVGRGDSQKALPFKREGRIVYPTLAANRAQVIATYEKALDDALRAAGFRD